MPEICRFEGIIIQMYSEGGSRHLPHFHARYGEFHASFAVDPVEILAGSLPRRQRRLVEAWAELRMSELKANWERLYEGAPALKIDALR